MIRHHTVWKAVAVCLTASAVFGLSSSRADDGTWAICVMQADGSNVRQVARADAYRAHGSPRWSHDGKRLVFDVSGGPGGARKCFAVKVDGSGLQELGDHAMPDWSADDKQLIYSHYGGGGVQAGTWVQNLDGQGRTWMVEGISARWSPDGKRLALTIDYRIYVLDVGGAEAPQPIAGQVARNTDPAWSPDGKSLAFASDRQ